MKSKGLQAEVYAFPSILTFSACTPPLDQVLELWDFLLAFGVHLNVLCVVAQLYLIRDEIMTEIRCVTSGHDAASSADHFAASPAPSRC